MGVQAPIVHELFIAQVVQALPPAPHCDAFCAPNGTHRLPWQQPFEHEVGVQVGTMEHWPMLQVEPLPQGEQAAPAWPHALLFWDEKPTQSGPTQQPLQVAGPPGQP